MTGSQQVLIGLIGGVLVLIFSCLFPQMIEGSSTIGAFVGATMGSFSNRMILERRGITQSFLSILIGFLFIVLVGNLLIALVPLKLVPTTSSSRMLPVVIVTGLGLLYAVISSGRRFWRKG